MNRPSNTPRYTPCQILGMRTATLRYLLGKQLAVNSELAGKIAALTGFEHRWYNASPLHIAMVALAWAIIVNDAAPLDHDLRTAMNALRNAKERAQTFDKLNKYVED